MKWDWEGIRKWEAKFGSKVIMGSWRRSVCGVWNIK